MAPILGEDEGKLSSARIENNTDGQIQKTVQQINQRSKPGRRSIMDKQQHQPRQYHYRRRHSRHAISNVTHGHTPRNIRNIVSPPAVSTTLPTNVFPDGQVPQLPLVYTYNRDAPDTSSEAHPPSSPCLKLHIQMQRSYLMQRLR